MIFDFIKKICVMMKKSADFGDFGVFRRMFRTFMENWGVSAIFVV